MPSGNRVKKILMRGFYSSCLGFDCTWPDGCLIARYSLSPRIPAAILRSLAGLDVQLCEDGSGLVPEDRRHRAGSSAFVHTRSECKQWRQ